MLNEHDRKAVVMRNIRNRLAASRKDEGLDIPTLSSTIRVHADKVDQELLRALDADAVKTYREALVRPDASRPLLTASLTTYAVGYTLEYMKDHAMRTGNVGEVIAWIDTMTGFERVLSLIQLGELEASGELHTVVGEVFRDVQQSTTLEEDVLTQMQTLYVSRREARISEQLLRTDPSGLLVINSAIQRFGEALTNPEAPREPYLPSNVVPEFFLIGAQIARDAYSRLYPLTA